MCQFGECHFWNLLVEVFIQASAFKFKDQGSLNVGGESSFNFLGAGRTNSGEKGFYLYNDLRFTYNYYLGYYMRMHYDCVRSLDSSIHVPLTWTLNTSSIIAIKNKSFHI